jgi:hypothetical protein
MLMQARSAHPLRYVGATLFGVSALFAGSFMLGGLARSAPKTTLHFAANGNFGQNGSYLPGKFGFNLADVSSASQLGLLPEGVKGLAWVGRCDGVDRAFLDAVRAYIGNPKLLGFYFMDDPDPTGRYFRRCAADKLKAQSDWIHANAPGVLTFIILMNMSSLRDPSFADTYNYANSHVDLFGLDPYPCRSELKGCDYDLIDHYVAAADSFGITRDRMVPVYQTFGGGHWQDGEGGYYTLPTVAEEQQIIARWTKLVATPVFDFAYSWGSQRGDLALESSPDLQMVFSVHNGAANMP